MPAPPREAGRGRGGRHTRVLLAAPVEDHRAAIDEAAGILRAGGLVAFPTETVYGLGANALDAAACQRLYTAKGRAADDPCIVHLASARELPSVVAEIPAVAERLAAAFWPGPLSLVLSKAPAIPAVVTAGRDTVAVRVPAHPVALALLRTAAVPVAAPSANRFMHTSPTRADHVLADLDGRIDLILDGGPTRVGVESTVLDLTGERPLVLRPGGITLEQLRAVLGEVEVLDRARASAGPARSPGLQEKHYAPDAAVEVFEGPPSRALPALGRRGATLTAQGKRVGLLLADEDLADGVPEGVVIERLGPRTDLRAVAARLYDGLRALEAAGVDVILCAGFPARGLGRAIGDRLRRAAGQATSHGA